MLASVVGIEQSSHHATTGTSLCHALQCNALLCGALVQTGQQVAVKKIHVGDAKEVGGRVWYTMLDR